MDPGDPFGDWPSSPAGSSSAQNHRSSGRPNYMTVGSGSTSEQAARLQAMLDQDSGYGGSEVDGTSMSRGFNPGMTEDRFTPASPGGPTAPQCEINANPTKLTSSSPHAILTLIDNSRCGAQSTRQPCPPALLQSEPHLTRSCHPTNCRNTQETARDELEMARPLSYRQAPKNT